MALAAGIPILVTPAPGVSILVNPGLGVPILVTPAPGVTLFRGRQNEREIIKKKSNLFKEHHVNV